MTSDFSQTLKAATACIRCGACMEVCPLYQKTGREAAVARGKLSLLQAFLGGTLSPSGRLLEILEYCLLCGACVERCTAKIPIPDLVKAGRAEIYDRLGHNWSPNLALAHLSLHADRLLPALNASSSLLPRLISLLGRKSGLLYRLWPSLAGLVERLPQPASQPLTNLVPDFLPSAGKQKIAFFIGCGLQALFPQAGLAFLKICQRLGIEVIIPKQQNCCGLLATSVGDLKTARLLGRNVIRQFAGLKVDYLVTACASCSYQLKRLDRLFPDSLEREQAGSLALKVKEASEYLADLERLDHLHFPARVPSTSVVFHDPCHGRRGQQIVRQPRQVLAARPRLELREPHSPVACCGQGGLFGICHPDMGKAIGLDALASYQQTGADLLATSCSGCLVQLMSLTTPALPVRHFLEILAEALE
ncbi:(Fe-S)-binding protein [Desulfobacca acetoxidans]|uniref:Glycolate oxidase iron-sulfur subunit n=1 Tax=Desulfobacca acetoxidans (strain ATCC 700848 / DSM 11109 / ASRB2) TaxID=880072 RepID=F2NGA7_DESAR|nr:(Fe-S)-binding protein [Desulfobacca acetoxidans]AEB08520.1 protein of unknown function DUF224 cysteine-rich region domain protein [Desulfobacca acetoxidans DSM 11109]